MVEALSMLDTLLIADSDLPVGCCGRLSPCLPLLDQGKEGGGGGQALRSFPLLFQEVKAHQHLYRCSGVGRLYL